MTVTSDFRPDGVVTLTLDDGRLNLLELAVFQELNAALDAVAEADARAIVVQGREGFLSAGLNAKALPTMDDDHLHELLVTFGRTLLRLWLEPRPTVCAATGHAIAGGTMLAMACDHAVAAEGEFRWGLNETQIGFPLPEFGIVLARGNVRTDRLDDLLLPGAMIAPEEAVAVGFADETAPPGEVSMRAHAKALELATLPVGAYAATKRRLRGAAAEAAIADLSHDIRSVLALRQIL